MKTASRPLHVLATAHSVRARPCALKSCTFAAAAQRRELKTSDRALLATAMAHSLVARPGGRRLASLPPLTGAASRSPQAGPCPVWPWLTAGWLHGGLPAEPRQEPRLPLRERGRGGPWPRQRRRTASRARRLVSASVSARWCQDPNNHMILRVLAGALPGSGAGAVAGRQQAMSERHQSARSPCVGGLS